MNSPTNKKLSKFQSCSKFNHSSLELELETFPVHEIDSKVLTSPLSFSLIDEKFGDFNSLSFQASPNSWANSVDKDEKTCMNSPRSSFIQKKIYEKTFKIQQLEIEIEYCKEQLRINGEELSDLKMLMQEKDSLIRDLMSGSDLGVRFKGIIDKQDEMIKDLRNNVERLQKINEKLGSDIKVLHSNRETPVAREHLFSREVGHRRGQQSSYDFQRQVGKALEKEILQLKEENDNLRMKICEIQGFSGNDSLSLYRKLRAELKVENPSDVLKRVIYLKENYQQSNEIRSFVIKAKEIVSRRCKIKNASFEDILNFISCCSAN